MSKIKCRNCKKELVYVSMNDIPTFPFCSERCQLIDLGLWLSEEQRIDEPITDDKAEKYKDK